MLTARYWGFDAGIDDDDWCLRKGFKKIEFDRSNWNEGEIKASSNFTRIWIFYSNQLRKKLKNINEKQINSIEGIII